MGLKPDIWIRDTALKHRMIEPFADHSPPGPIISYGLSSYGYDLRLADEFNIFTNVNSAIVDPKAFSKDSFVTRKGSVCLMPPPTRTSSAARSSTFVSRGTSARGSRRPTSRASAMRISGDSPVDRLMSILNRTAAFDTPNLSRYTTTA